MSRTQYLIAAAIILAISFYNYSVEMLTDLDYTPAQIMLSRGSMALVLGMAIALIKKQPLLPNHWRPQIVRFFLTGTAAYLAIVAYQYLSAATVSLIYQLDVPIVIFISAFGGQKKSPLQFWLSLWTVLTVLYLAVDARFIDEEPEGFLFAIVSVCMVCVGYFLVKKASVRENAFMISNVFSLSNVVFGLALLLINRQAFRMDAAHVWIFVVGAVSQVSLYLLAVQLYRWFDIEKTRLPYVLATVFILIMEMVMEQKYFGTSQIGLTLLVTGMLVTIILNPGTPKAVERVLNLKKEE